MKRKFVLVGTALLLLFCSCGRQDVAFVPNGTIAPQTTTEVYEPSVEATDENKKPDAGTLPADATPHGTHFFDDAVFVGDSVTLGLKNYVNSRRNKNEECLGNAQFLCVGSMAYWNMLIPISPKSLHPTFQGTKVTLEEGIQRTGAKKAFIMLGMNDFSGVSEDKYLPNINAMLDRIQEKNPNLIIYIESVTPILDGMEHGGFTNERIQHFNECMQSICKERGLRYIDINGQVMADETGHLKKDYCGDPTGMGIHMTHDGCRAWIDYLTKQFCE